MEDHPTLKNAPMGEVPNCTKGFGAFCATGGGAVGTNKNTLNIFKQYLVLFVSLFTDA